MAKGAPLGNQFWKLRYKHGRDKIFATPDELWNAACEYFQWCDNNPLVEVEQAKSGSFKLGEDKDGKPIAVPNLIELPKMRAYTLQGLCIYLDCNTKYIYDFEDGMKGKDDDLSKAFSEILSRIREVIYTQKFTGAAAGFLNPNLIARSLGLSERQENRQVDGQGNDVPIVPALNITVSNPGIKVAESE